MSSGSVTKIDEMWSLKTWRHDANPPELNHAKGCICVAFNDDGSLELTDLHDVQNVYIPSKAITALAMAHAEYMNRKEGTGS